MTSPGMHAKNIDSNRQHDSSPNADGHSFPPYTNHERNIPPTHDANSSRPYRPKLLCIITMGGPVQNDHGWLNAFGEL